MDKIVYDAFISYSHSEPDSYIAERLHFMLEHYHISGKIREISGKKKISRVFRDREELPLSSDLAANIKDALEHSEYLIVICSPRSARSEWVLREISTFLETHGKEKVLTLLAEGEPEEAFPEILCYSEEKVTGADGQERIVRNKVEPMAADVRGKTRREMEKKLRDEFLRILAPMLSCTYDMLRQRHREYRLRRGIAATGTAAVLAAMFMVYAFHQASVSEGRYQEARRNQARYLAQISGELLAQGDREGALKTAMAVRPETEEDAPVVPEQMYALNNALYSYDRTNQICYRPARTTELDGQTDAGAIWDGSRLSPGEDGYFCVDRLGSAYVLDPADGTCIWKISPGDIEGLEAAKFEDFFPAAEDTAVLLCGGAAVYADWQEKDVICMVQDEDMTASDMAAALYGERIALTDGRYVWLFDLGTGECLQKARCYDGEYGSYTPGSLSFSEDGSMLAAGLSVDHNEIEPQRGLMLFSVETGEGWTISEREAAQVLWLGNDAVAAIHYAYPDRAEAKADAPRRSFTVAVYDPETGDLLWESEPYRTQAMNNPCELKTETMKVDGDARDVLIASVKDRICIYDPETGEMLQDRSYPENICGFFRYDSSRLLVGLEDGSVRLCTMEQMSTEYEVGGVSAPVSDFVFSGKNNTVIWPVDQSRKIVAGQIFQDENMECLSLEESIESVEYFTVRDEESGKDATYRCVLCSTESGSFSDTIVKVYRSGSADLLFEYECPEEDQWIGSLHVQDVDGTPVILINTYGAEYSLVAGNLETGQTVWQHGLKTSEGYIITPYFFHGAEKILLCDSYTFVTADLNLEGLDIPETAEAGIPVSRVDDVVMSADDRFAIFRTWADEEQCIRVWDTENRTWAGIDGAAAYPVSSRYGDAVSVGYEGSTVAVWSENGTIDLIDLEKGEVMRSLPCGYYGTLCFSFMDHDRYLAACGDGTCLMLWDVETGEMLMQDKELDVSVSVMKSDGSEHFFALGFYGYMMDDKGLSTSSLRIYYVDDEGRFYPYADVPDGYVDFGTGEIFTADSGGCFTKTYTYRELAARAEDVLGGEALTEAEKKQYFISE